MTTGKYWDASRRLNIYMPDRESRERFNAAATAAGFKSRRGHFVELLLDTFAAVNASTTATCACGHAQLGPHANGAGACSGYVRRGTAMERCACTAYHAPEAADAE